MAVLIEKVDDDLYVNPLAVDYVEIERQARAITGSARVVLHFRSGVTVARKWQSYDEAVVNAKGWQSLLNAGHA